MALASDVRKLNPSGIVELFELDLTPKGLGTLRFYSGTNESNGDVVWQGNTYTAIPMEATGFKATTNGTLPRPLLKTSNVYRELQDYLLTYDDLLGMKVTRKRTLVKYLDAVNFTGGNVNADPNTYFADDVYFISRKASEDRIFVTFELSTYLEYLNIKLPKRQCLKDICLWQYKSTECGYSGGAVADKFDVATSDPNQDDCSKTITGCKFRFGTYGELRFGGFPTVGLFT